MIAKFFFKKGLGMRMKLSEYLHTENIKLELTANNKEEALRELAGLLKDKVNDFEGFVSAILARESAGSTAMEYGLCIPHVRTKYVNEFAIAVGTKKEGIYCDSLDKKKSTVFFLIASNDETKLLHLDALVKISRLLKSDVETDLLCNTKSKEGFIELIKKMEEK